MTNAKRAYAWIAFGALVSHVTCLSAGFIWLDHAHLEERLALAPNGDFLVLFTRGFAGTGYYRPLMSVALSLDALLGGAPWLFHASTLLWHAAAAVLTAVAAQSLGLSRRVAFGAGLLFAVHPVTSLVASVVAFRSESMLDAALLGLIALHVRGKAWASGAALLAGALTKETALVLAPLFILTLELLPATGSARAAGPERRAARTRVLVWEGAALVVALLLRFRFAPSWRALGRERSASGHVNVWSRI